MPAKILVVDDEPGSLNLSRRTLESQGYNVLTASNGQEALEKGGREMPDLILLDVVMPGLSGFEVCRTLKTQKRTRLIHVIMLTHLARDVDIDLGKEVCADGHIVKSLSSEDLVAEVETHLREAHLTKFSGNLELSHSQILGKKVLLEVDPATTYESCIRDFILETRAHGEAVVILARKASAVFQTAAGEEGAEVVPLTAQTLLSPILEAHAGKRFALVYDNLSELVLSLGFQAAYRFTKSTLELLEPLVTALFLLNPDAHSQSETASFRGLFSNQVRFSSEGLTALRLHV